MKRWTRRALAIGLATSVFTVGPDYAAAGPPESENAPRLLKNVERAWLVGDVRAPFTPRSGWTRHPWNEGIGRDSLFPALYLSYVTLQVLDVHSTRRALDAGAHEANPIMGSVVRSDLAFVAVKAATTAGVMLLTQRLRKQSPLMAVLTLTAVTAVQALVVAHNYRAVWGR